jgi:glycerol-3-phosphate dehydrogenase
MIKIKTSGPFYPNFVTPNMKRSIDALRTQKFDLLVIGAGAHGIFTALDASLRGLSVALIDRADLCAETSMNSLRTIHGGIRYLQYFQFKRTLESIREQAILHRLAPGFMQTLPFVMPCAGHGMRGPLVLFAGLQLHQWLRILCTLDINGFKHLPRSKVLSASAYRDKVEGVVTPNLTGAAIWPEVQMQDTNALLMACAEVAAAADAQIANYVEATQLIQSDNSITGAHCLDRLSGKTFDISARLTINATGPWTEPFLRSAAGNLIKPMPVALTESMNVVLKRQLFTGMTVALPSERKVEGEAIADTNRMYFVVPWRGRSVIGTVQVPWVDNATTERQRARYLQEYLAEINAAYPQVKLTMADVDHVYWGRVPTEDALDETGRKRRDCDEIVDHAQRDNLTGLLSIVGVKLTTARLVGKHAVDAAVKQLGGGVGPSTTHNLRLSMPENDPCQPSAHRLKDEARFKYRLQQAIDNEMAMTASDFLYRRTDLGILGGVRAVQQKWLKDCLPEHATFESMDVGFGKVLAGRGESPLQ